MEPEGLEDMPGPDVDRVVGGPGRQEELLLQRKIMRLNAVKSYARNYLKVACLFHSCCSVALTCTRSREQADPGIPLYNDVIATPIKNSHKDPKMPTSKWSSLFCFVFFDFRSSLCRKNSPEGERG